MVGKKKSTISTHKTIKKLTNRNFHCKKNLSHIIQSDTDPTLKFKFFRMSENCEEEIINEK
jgi:hypothetical protein